MAWQDLRRYLPVERWRYPAPTVAVLRFDGIIAARPRGGVSLRRFAAPIERAFSFRNLKAVALSINSPGGAPAQTALLFRRIRQLAAERQVPVLAFTEDVAASGGYWLALAADEIFAEESSLLGSIGVVTASFGFAQVLARLGVERRLYTAGERKSLLDPFLPENAADVERLGTLQRELHDGFKSVVRSRRAGKLRAGEDVLFNGDVFTGARALDLGLIDGIGDLRGIMRERFGEEVRLRVVEPERRRFGLLGFRPSRRPEIGDIAFDLLARLEERLIWARFGL
jgi:signal peptide peptidase SppA